MKKKIMNIDLPICITGIIEKWIKWCDEIEVLLSNILSQSKWVSVNKKATFPASREGQKQEKKLMNLKTMLVRFELSQQERIFAADIYNPTMTWHCKLQIANCNWKKIMPQLKKKDFPIPRGEGNQS